MWRLVVTALGIYATFLTHGVAHERLSTTKYGAAQAHFPGLGHIAILQCLASTVVRG